MKIHWTAAWLAAGALPAGAAPVTIELQPAAMVRGAQVRLAQVAHLTTTDLPQLRRLMELPLGSAPAVGNAVVLERESLARWLRTRAGLRPQEIVWEGVAATTVTSASNELQGHEVVHAAQAALQAWLVQRSERARVQALSVPPPIRLPQGDVSLRPRALDETQPRKRMLVWVDVWVEDRFVRTLPVNFEVAAYATAPVALAGAPAGAPLPPESTVARQIDVTQLDSPALSPGFAASPGQRLRGPIRAGEVLTARNVESAPAIARGEWVTARSVIGAVSLESRVQALEDGRVGQVVQVKQANASSAVAARVMAQGQVEVQP